MESNKFSEKVNYFVVGLIQSCIHCNTGATSLITLGKMLNIVLGILCGLYKNLVHHI
jgi:hypothetical protein